MATWAGLTADEWATEQASAVRWATRLVGHRERAEDLVSDALVRVGARVSRGADIQNPAGYLRTIVRNLIADHHRRPEPCQLELDEELDSGHPGCAAAAPDDIDGLLTRTVLLDALARLSEQQQRVLLCRMLGYSHPEIAELLDLDSEGASAALAFRARRSLVLALGDAVVATAADPGAGQGRRYRARAGSGSAS
ncbi:RNA polymerase sigma factor [Nocardioides speluncae]|uniref:RNA polymerase sigma factor n=1 Tax=Nocardioides speluncae TaxID=2670337 RepID=UPI000D68759D|nr:sigma-70 family RNA polymerase sigma factor [Nocardioides speluncae]